MSSFTLPAQSVSVSIHREKERRGTKKPVRAAAVGTSVVLICV